MQIEVQCIKNYFNFFIAGASGKTKKKNRRSHPQNWKKISIKYLERIFVLTAIQCKCYFFANMF